MKLRSGGMVRFSHRTPIEPLCLRMKKISARTKYALHFLFVEFRLRPLDKINLIHSTHVLCFTNCKKKINLPLNRVVVWHMKNGDLFGFRHDFRYKKKLLNTIRIKRIKKTMNHPKLAMLQNICRMTLA